MVAAAEVVGLGLEDSASVVFLAAGVGVEDEKKGYVSKAGSKRCCCCEGGGGTKVQQHPQSESSSGQKKNKCYELVDYESLPEYLKHNEFILGYYRSNWPWKETLLSIFSIHNETINVWTHLIGFFVFLALTIGTTSVAMAPVERLPVLRGGEPLLLMLAVKTKVSGLMIMGNDERNASSSSLPAANWYLQADEYSHMDDYGSSERFFSLSNRTNDAHHAPTTATVASSDNDEDVADATSNTPSASALEPITRWPFMAFLCGAMFCLLTSSMCHLLCCHSERCSYVMLRLDYAGISALIVTSFYPLVYYAFLCHPFYLRLYLSAITLSGLAAALVSLIPVFDSPSFRFVRAALFFCMGASSLVPIFHKLALYGASGRPEVLVATAYEMLMGLCYGAGVVVYATRVPERWMPGKFDLAGHSHQLFHVLVVAGAYMHYLAGVVYLQWRDADGCGMM